MTSTYDARGRRVGATVVEIQPNFVTQIRSLENKDGYNAVQIGMGNKKSIKKPQAGHLKKIGLDQRIKWFKEVKGDREGLELGQQISIGQVFFIGDSVKVTGVSKGRGFAGGVKRYGFHGGPKTHGQSDRHRAPGSIGSGTTPGRVFKGKKMAGHMGVRTVSVRGLEVIAVDQAKNLLTVKGALPGPVGQMVIIEKQGKTRGYTPPPEEKPDEEEEASESVSSVEPEKTESTDSTEPTDNTESTEKGEKEDAN